jgi:hypothetical protein
MIKTSARTIAGLLVLVSLCAAGAAVSPGISGADVAKPEADMSRVYNAALGGDMTKALSILDAIDRTRMSPGDSTSAECIRQTFGAPPQPEQLPPRSREILSTYRTYWQTVMLQRAETGQAEGRLLESLNAVFSSDPHDTTRSADLGAASEHAKAVIESEDLHALTGVTSPYWELMIWRTEEPKTYRVKLPERSIDVRVVFLDGLVSLGWAGYATCGHAHTGGWATNEALYSLKSSYDTSSENFRVSYLAHEGRHFSDYKQFPHLEQPELEYRAKLTEIALSKETTRNLIQAFARGGGRDRAVPHSFANYCVTRDLSRDAFGTEEGAKDATKWDTLQPERIRSGALTLLKQNEQKLRRMGAKKVAHFLEASPEP